MPPLFQRMLGRISADVIKLRCLCLIIAPMCRRDKDAIFVFEHCSHCIHVPYQMREKIATLARQFVRVRDSHSRARPHPDNPHLTPKLCSNLSWPSCQTIGNPSVGAAGGSGVVILRYPTADVASYSQTGLTITETTDGSDTVLEITAGTGTVSFA